MSKRAGEHEDGPLKAGHRPDAMDVDMDSGNKPADNDMGDFEDEFEDEFESEDEILEAGVDGRPDAEREAEQEQMQMQMQMDVDAMEGGAAAAAAAGGGGGPSTFIVGRSKLEHGQTLAPDPSTYHMLHNLSTPWPCLSFDIVRDTLGDSRTVYPATMYTVSGTQAEGRRADENALMVIKFAGLSRMDRGGGDDDDDGSDDDDDGDDDEDADPILESKTIPLSSTTNRIRAHQTPAADPSTPPTTLVATMTESSDVYIHDITPHLASFDTPGTVVSDRQNKPLSTIRAHKAEGYAVDWSPLSPAGRLATGDNDGLIYITSRTDGGGWVTDTRPLTGHTSSVEEIQWSPSEDKVLASASSDGTIRIWDIRSKSRKPMISMQVSAVDVNVMSWSKQRSNLLASGDDAGVWGVWDLRQWKPNATEKPTPVASFDYHKEQITSVEWHPTDDSIVAVAAADNTVTLWDLAVELDDEESKDTAGVQDVPPQLLFVHYHEQAKEVHWHPQIPGALVATGQEFSIFKTISV